MLMPYGSEDATIHIKRDATYFIFIKVQGVTKNSVHMV